MDGESICSAIGALQNLREVVANDPNIDQESPVTRGFKLASARLLAQLILEFQSVAEGDAALEP